MFDLGAAAYQGGVVTRPVRGRGPLSVTAQQAKVDYLALGSERSLRRLTRYYDESDTEFPPSLQTLAAWSRRDGWQSAAADHDEFVGAALLTRLRESAVQQAFDRVAALTNAAQHCLDTAAEADLKTAALTASDIKALVSTAIDALKMVEVLTGGVSDREERSSGIAEEALLLLRQIEDQKREGLPVLLPTEAKRPSAAATRNRTRA
jgi:hypothetical protein